MHDIFRSSEPSERNDPAMMMPVTPAPAAGHDHSEESELEVQTRNLNPVNGTKRNGHSEVLRNAAARRRLGGAGSS